MKDLKGRKVKVLPHGLCYLRSKPDENVCIIQSHSSAFVNVMFGDGTVCPCPPHELRYLNNRKVVLNE